MRILVTGGAGFIGGHLAESFLRDGHDVVVFDNFDPFYDTEIKEHNVEIARSVADQTKGSYELVRGDVRDADKAHSVVDDAEYIFHQAGQAGVRESVDTPRKYDEVNVKGTLNLLDAARDTGIERFVLASSSSVYGDPEYLPYDENHPTRPVSPYGASKLAQERYAHSYGEVYDFPVVSLRYFAVFGPRMRPNMAISNFVSRCFNDEPPVVYGDGTQTRGFTYIDDVVEANRKLLETSGADGETLNIGSGDRIEIQTLAREVRDQLTPNLDLAHDERHDADAQHTAADVSKAGDRIGYDPSTSIREGIQSFIDWYRENRNWYEPLVRNS